MGDVPTLIVAPSFAVKEASVPIPVSTTSPSARDQLELQSAPLVQSTKETATNLRLFHLAYSETVHLSRTVSLVLLTQSPSLDYNGLAHNYYIVYYSRFSFQGNNTMHACIMCLRLRIVDQARSNLMETKYHMKLHLAVLLTLSMCACTC